MFSYAIIIPILELKYFLSFWLILIFTSREVCTIYKICIFIFRVAFAL